MSSQVIQKTEVKFRILIALADAAVWIHGSALATKANTTEDRMKDTLDYYEKRNMIKTVDWFKLTPDEQKKFMEDEDVQVSSAVKKLYKIDAEGWKKFERIIKPCFQDENVSEILNIPENISKRFRD